MPFTAVRGGIHYDVRARSEDAGTNGRKKLFLRKHARTCALTPHSHHTLQLRSHHARTHACTHGVPHLSSLSSLSFLSFLQSFFTIVAHARCAL